MFIDSFVRNPDWHGFFTANFQPSEAFNIDLTGNLTGEMQVPRVVNSNGLIRLNKSPVFFDLNLNNSISDFRNFLKNQIIKPIQQLLLSLTILFSISV